MPVNNFNIVRTDVVADRTATTCTFSENNNADFIVLVMTANSTTGDTAAPQATFTDENGNVFNLMQFSAETAGVFQPAIAIYASNRIAGKPSSTVYDMTTLAAPMLPVDVTDSSINGFEFQSSFPLVSFDAFNSLLTTDGGEVTVAATGTDDLVMMVAQLPTLSTFALQYQKTPSGETGWLNETIIETPNTFVATGWIEASQVLNTLTYTGNMIWGGPDSVSYTLFALVGGGQNTGSSASGSLSFNINRGPLPDVLKEGREICTVQIDCTQIPIDIVLNDGGAPNTVLAYPELNLINGGGPNSFWQTAIVREFDLEYINRSAGLSQVRSILAYSRPFFGIDPNFVDVTNPDTQDLSSNLDITSVGGAVGIGLITNLSTLQTVVLGGRALMDYASETGGSQIMIPAEILQLQFPANKGSMKMRFIGLSGTFNGQTAPYMNLTGCGKFTLQFVNWEIPSALIESVGLGYILVSD